MTNMGGEKEPGLGPQDSAPDLAVQDFKHFAECSGSEHHRDTTFSVHDNPLSWQGSTTGTPTFGRGASATKHSRPVWSKRNSSLVVPACDNDGAPAGSAWGGQATLAGTQKMSRCAKVVILVVAVVLLLGTGVGLGVGIASLSKSKSNNSYNDLANNLATLIAMETSKPPLQISIQVLGLTPAINLTGMVNTNSQLSDLLVIRTNQTRSRPSTPSQNSVKRGGDDSDEAGAALISSEYAKISSEQKVSEGEPAAVDLITKEVAADVAMQLQYLMEQVRTTANASCVAS